MNNTAKKGTTTAGEPKALEAGRSLSPESVFKKITRYARFDPLIDHGSITELDATSEKGVSSVFARVAMMSEDEVFQHVKGLLIEKGYKVVADDKFYLIAEGNIPIMLNAHVDTVFENPPSKMFVTGKTGIVFTTDVGIGIGADDRSGVSVIVELIERGYRPHVVVTKLEEKGDQGARELVYKFRQNPLETRYIIGLDRRGSNDAVYYYLSNNAFKRYIAENFGFKEDRGSVADISVLCPAWNVAGVNISTGYHNPHSPDEFQSLPILESITDRVAAMLEKVPVESFGYVSKGEEAMFLKRNEDERARDEEYRSRQSKRDAARKAIADFRSNPETAKMYADAMSNFAPMSTRVSTFDKEGMKNKKPSRAALELRGYSEKRIRRFGDIVDKIAMHVPYCVFNFAKMLFYHVNKEGNIVEHELSFDEMDKLGIFTMSKVDRAIVLENDVKELEALVFSVPGAINATGKACKQDDDRDRSMDDAEKKGRKPGKASLAVLAEDTNLGVRRDVAGKPSTTRGTLAVLAKDADVGVRLHVADNPSTPAAALVVLAGDEDADVRRFVAGNPSTPALLRARLMRL